MKDLRERAVPTGLPWRTKGDDRWGSQAFGMEKCDGKIQAGPPIPEKGMAFQSVDEGARVGGRAARKEKGRDFSTFFGTVVQICRLGPAS